MVEIYLAVSAAGESDEDADQIQIEYVSKADDYTGLDLVLACYPEIAVMWVVT